MCARRENIQIYLKDTRCWSVDRLHLAQRKVQLLAVVNEVTSVRVQKQPMNAFSINTIPHGIVKFLELYV
jgi:hypothetical protein